MAYQFDWKGDGTDLSGWGSSTQSKTWTVAGVYQVRARARCATDTGVVSGWSNILSVTISQATVSCIVATFPSGLQVVVDGTTYTAPKALSWVPGSSHTVSVLSPQAGSAGSQYVFASWSDGGGQSHSITASSATTYTANFATQYSLTSSVSPSGAGTVSPSGTVWYNSGQERFGFSRGRSGLQLFGLGRGSHGIDESVVVDHEWAEECDGQLQSESI